MRKISILLAAASLLVLASVIAGATVAGATIAHAAKAQRGPRGPKGKKGPRGHAGAVGQTGPAGHAGATGPVGPAGNDASSGLNHFSKLVPFNGTESLTIGQFTISEVAGPSACTTVNLVNNSTFNAEISIIEGTLATPGPGQYEVLPMASSTPIANATATVGDVATFSAVLVNGSSSVTGTAGGLTLGNGCLVSGTVTGS
jgi:hypothetical protein